MGGRTRRLWLKTGVGLIVGLKLLSATPVGLPPPACVADTLAAYIALGAGGCSVGADYAYHNFAFTVVSSSGGPSPVGTGSIVVTPLLGPTGPVLTFSSAGFLVSSGQSITYSLRYDLDPHPILIGLDLEMMTNTPVAPGFATIDATLCIGDTLPACTLGTLDTTLSVNHLGSSSSLLDSTSFAATSFLDIELIIVLDATAGGSSEISGFGNSITAVPEPGTFFLTTAAIALLTLRRYRKRF